MDKIEINLSPSFMVMVSIIFIALKLMGYLSLSWWWVTMPLWIMPLVGVIAMMLVSLVFGIYYAKEMWKILRHKK